MLSLPRDTEQSGSRLLAVGDLFDELKRTQDGPSVQRGRQGSRRPTEQGAERPSAPHLPLLLPRIPAPPEASLPEAGLDTRGQSSPGRLPSPLAASRTPTALSLSPRGLCPSRDSSWASA